MSRTRMLPSVHHLKVPFLLFALSAAGSRADAQTIGAGDSAETIFTKLGCQFVAIASSPVMVGVAVMAALLIFGWNKMMAEASAFSSFRNSVIGAVIILAGSKIIQTMFGNSC